MHVGYHCVTHGQSHAPEANIPHHHLDPSQVRNRLAPIRGIPTKSGAMQDANSDLKEIFDAIESIPAAPAKLVGDFLSWARGEQDPDWGKKPSDKPKAPKPW